MVPLFVMMILPFLNGSFDSANLTNKLNDSGLAVGRAPARARLAVADVLVGVGGRRLCHVRARVQGHRARHEAGAPLGGAVLDGRLHPAPDRASSAAPAPKLVGGVRLSRARWTRSSARRRFTDFFVVCLIASFIITMNTATADGGRALYGISRDGMTVKQLGMLNRFNVPGNAMTRRHGRQHPLRPLHRQHLRHPRGEQPRLRARAHVRALGLRAAAAETGRTGHDRSSSAAIWTPIAGLLAVWCLILTIVGFGWFQIRGRRLRRHQGEGDRRRRARHRPAALLLPPPRAGQGAASTGVRRRRRCPRRLGRRYGPVA